MKRDYHKNNNNLIKEKEEEKNKWMNEYHLFELPPYKKNKIKTCIVVSKQRVHTYFYIYVLKPQSSNLVAKIILI